MSHISRAEKRRVTRIHMDAISKRDEQLIGPIYGAELFREMPLGGMIQEMPKREELQKVKQVSERTVAAYEVLTSHYREKCNEVERLKFAIRRVIDGEWSPTGLQELVGDLK